MQPIQYNRVYDFTGYQASSPSIPLPGNQVDAELNAIKATTDAIRANLAIIQRDDTLLGNNTVHPDAFTVASQAPIAGSAGWQPRGPGSPERPTRSRTSFRRAAPTTSRSRPTQAEPSRPTLPPASGCSP